MTVTETSRLSIDSRVGYPMFDADQHYYEAEDAMTRHLPHEFQRMVRWVDIDGRRRLGRAQNRRVEFVITAK